MDRLLLQHDGVGRRDPPVDVQPQVVHPAGQVTEQVTLLHFDASVQGWVDVTTRADRDANVVCGVVDHLSPFVVVRPAITTDTGPASAVVRTRLLSAVPNPFNLQTRLRFDLARSGFVRLSIHDAAGRRVRELVATALPAGHHSEVWNGRDVAGRPVASDVYFVRMAADQTAWTQKLLLVECPLCRLRRRPWRRSVTAPVGHGPGRRTVSPSGVTPSRNSHT